MSISCLPSALPFQSSSASAKDEPCGWITKSTWHVVPPNAADVCPDSTSSIVTVPPKGMSRCVCGSMPPGRTYFPRASMTRSASTSKRLADQGDPLVLDEHVSDVVVCRGDDATAFDQDGHTDLPSRLVLTPPADHASAGATFSCCFFQSVPFVSSSISSTAASARS